MDELADLALVVEDQLDSEANSEQDKFLNHLLALQQSVYIFLKSGIRLQGSVISFDKYVIFLSSKTGTTAFPQMIYKQHIATILLADSLPIAKNK